MRLIFIGLIVMALLAAGGSVFFVKRYFAEQEGQQERLLAEKLASKTRILVADRSMPAGSVVTSGSLRWLPWPDDGVEPTYIVQPKGDNSLEVQFIGSIVRNEIGASEPITADKVFKRSEASFMSGMLAPGKRAITLPVDAVKSAAGFIQPGDRVDIIVTLDMNAVRKRLSEEGGLIAGKIVRFVAETVLHNVRVLAIDQATAAGGEKIKVGKTVTLEVSPREAELIVIARRMGLLSMVLRSLALDEPRDRDSTFTTDLEISPTYLALFRGAIEEEPQQAEPEPIFTPPPSVAPIPAPAPPAPPSPAPTVKTPASAPEPTVGKVNVYRGIKKTTESFESEASSE